MFSFVCRKIEMLPALLHLKRVFCQFAKASANFYLILLKKKRFRLFTGKVTLFSAISFFLFLFSYLNCTRRFILPKTCFGLVAAKLEASMRNLNT